MKLAVELNQVVINANHAKNCLKSASKAQDISTAHSHIKNALSKAKFALRKIKYFKSSVIPNFFLKLGRGRKMNIGNLGSLQSMQQDVVRNITSLKSLKSLDQIKSKIPSILSSLDSIKSKTERVKIEVRKKKRKRHIV